MNAFQAHGLSDRKMSLVRHRAHRFAKAFRTVVLCHARCAARTSVVTSKTIKVNVIHYGYHERSANVFAGRRKCFCRRSIAKTKIIANPNQNTGSEAASRNIRPSAVRRFSNKRPLSQQSARHSQQRLGWQTFEKNSPDPASVVDGSGQLSSVRSASFASAVSRSCHAVVD
jgi:hypothetical protein